MKARGLVKTVAPHAGRAVLIAVGWFVLVQIAARLVRRYWHFPSPPIISMLLDSPVRRALQSPAEVVAALGIRPGMTVLELGPGPGTFTIEAARRAEPGGKVVAVDIEPKMLAILSNKAQRFGVENIETHQADAYHIPLPDNAVDLAFMVTVLAEIPDRQRALAEIHRVLKPGGRLAIGEAIFDPDYPRRSTVIRWCERAGFRLEASYGSLLWYVLSFTKPIV